MNELVEVPQYQREHHIDGNGRAERLVMFKECLRANLTPFIITDDIRQAYLRGLREFEREPGYLLAILADMHRTASRHSTCL